MSCHSGSRTVNPSRCTQQFFENSWIYSVKKITDVYGPPILYADLSAKELLVDKLGIVFADVHLILNEVPKQYLGFFWYMKYFVASIQNEEFLHFDYDFYINEHIPKQLSSANVLFERKIAAKTFKKIEQLYYPKIYENIFPQTIENMLQQKFCYMTGILGGSQLDFYKTLHVKHKECIDAYLNYKLRHEEQCNIASERQLEFYANALALDASNVTPEVIADENKSSACAYTHVFLEKNNTIVDNKLKIRLSQEINQTASKQIYNITNITHPPVRVSMIVMPSLYGDVYRTLVNAVVPKKLPLSQLCVSKYRLSKTATEQIKGINKIQQIASGTNYFNSLQICAFNMDTEAVIIVDENLIFDVNCIINSVAAWMHDRQSLYCATIINSHTSNILQGCDYIDDYHAIPNVTTTRSRGIKEIGLVYGGFYVLSGDALHVLCQKEVSCEKFSDLVKNYSFRHYCVSDAVAHFIKSDSVFLP